MRNLALVWASHIKDSEKKKEFQEYIRNSRGVLERLTQIIDQELAEANKTREDDYDTASWACKQADRNGQIRVLNKLRLLTDLGEDHG